MIHPATELRFVDEEVGYGVFATRPIPRGTIAWVLCRFDRVYTRSETVALPAAYRDVLARYAYIDRDDRFVLCWDSGRYVNHSCEPSMLGVGPDMEVMVRDVQAGEQVTCEYAGLNLPGRMPCRCGAPSCRRFVGRDDVIRIAPEWDAVVADTLPLVRRVAQPLAPFLEDAARLDDWIDGRRPVPSHRDYLSAQPITTNLVDQQRPWTIPERTS